MIKLVLLGVIGFLLAGCGEDKITKEFLNGDWRCAESEYKRHDSGINEDLGSPISEYNSTMTFKIINNDLYQINKDGGKEVVDLNNTESDTTRISEDYKINTKYKIEAINSDTFKFTISTNIQDISNETKIIDLRTKTETVCTRIN